MTTFPAGSKRLLREIQLSLYLALDVAWLFAWSVALGSWIGPSRSGPLLTVPVVLGVVVAATAITRATLRRPGAPRRLPVAIGVLGLVVAAATGAMILWSARGAETWSDLLTRGQETSLGFRVLAAMVVVVIAWWRGIAAGRGRLTLEDVESAARTATIMLVLLFLLNALAPPKNEASLGTLIGTTVLVLFASLVSLPFARILDLGTSTRHQDQPAPAINRHWLALLLGTVLVLLVVTVVLAFVFTFERIDQLTRPLAGPADTLLWLIIYAIAIPLGFLVEGLIYLFRLLLHPGRLPPPGAAPNVNWIDRLREQSQHGTGPPEVLLSIAKGALVVLAAAIVLWLLARAVFRYADWLSGDDVTEDRDFVWSWSGLLTALRAVLQRWKQRPRWVARLVRHDHGGGTASLDAPPDPRALYRELLRLGQSLGRRRTQSETPSEYERALRTVSPLGRAEGELRTLTDVYARARYSPEPPTPGEVAAARDALRVLRDLEQHAAEEATGGPGNRPGRSDDHP